MRILFIRHHSVPSDKSGKYPYANNVYPPLGLAYIAAVLKQNDQSDIIEILDSRAQNLTLDQKIKQNQK